MDRIGGLKLVGKGYSCGTEIYQGSSVSINSDGTVIINGGPYDNNSAWSRSLLDIKNCFGSFGAQTIMLIRVIIGKV